MTGLEKRSGEGMGELEVEAVEMFVGFLRLIGLPKSVGEIYGVLFVAPEPMTMEDVVDRVGISLGAASQGLRLLRSVGAVKVVYMPGVRKDHYVADLELSRFATSFLKEEVGPRLERALERLGRMEACAEGMEPGRRRVTMERIERLRHWLDRGKKMLPWILRFLVK